MAALNYLVVNWNNYGWESEIEHLGWCFSGNVKVVVKDDMVLVCKNYPMVPKHQEAKEPKNLISYHANLTAKYLMLYLTKKMIQIILFHYVNINVMSTLCVEFVHSLLFL